MRSMPVRFVVATLLSVAGCGASSSVPDGGGPGLDARADAPADASPDGYLGPKAMVTGRVWVPLMAPGQVVAGEEVPVAGAAVYLSVERPTAIPDRIYCERCTERPADAVTSGPDGAFALEAIPGTYWLVIEKAQFRSEQQIELGAGPLALAAAQTTLPSTHDPVHGSWIPRIAVAAGTADHLEEVLGKIGLGAVDAGFRYTATHGEVHVYDNTNGAGPPLLVESRGSAYDLVWDLELMRRYHIIIVPCSSASVIRLDHPRVQANLRRYVMEGGKLFVTDYGGEVADTIFPPQLTLGGPGADTVGSYDPADPTAGTVTTDGSLRGSSFDSRDGEVREPELHAWLGGQQGPTTRSPATQAYDPDQLELVGNTSWISGLTPVPLGLDLAGQPVLDTPRTWVAGSGATPDGIKHPMTVSYQPTGCGRVLYSTFHTTGGPHRGLYPQERILLYMLLEAGVCQSGPVVN